jgi:hypothetical protein
MAKTIKARDGRKHNGEPVSKLSEHRIWLKIRSRCYVQADASFKSYGGRGIAMSDEWRECFHTFLADMGPRPSKQHSVDRINNNGNYCKGNCRWATATEQQNNTRANKTITHDGRTLTIAEWSRVTGIFMKTIAYRRRMGWPAEECLRVKDNRAGRTTRYIGVDFGNSTQH